MNQKLDMKIVIQFLCAAILNYYDVIWLSLFYLQPSQSFRFLHSGANQTYSQLNFFGINKFVKEGQKFNKFWSLQKICLETCSNIGGYLCLQASYTTISRDKRVGYFPFRQRLVMFIPNINLILICFSMVTYSI